MANTGREKPVLSSWAHVIGKEPRCRFHHGGGFLEKTRSAGTSWEKGRGSNIFQMSKPEGGHILNGKSWSRGERNPVLLERQEEREGKRALRGERKATPRETARE